MRDKIRGRSHHTTGTLSDTDESHTPVRTALSRPLATNQIQDNLSYEEMSNECESLKQSTKAIKRGVYQD